MCAWMETVPTAPKDHSAFMVLEYACLPRMDYLVRCNLSEEELYDPKTPRRARRAVANALRRWFRDGCPNVGEVD
jgi:hypothetical protein